MFVAVKEKYISDYLAAVQAAVMTGDEQLAQSLWQETRDILPTKLIEFERVLADRLEGHFSGAAPFTGEPGDWGTNDYCTVQ
jgi:hypothetical protein